jgi:hypothetical protein
METPPSSAGGGADKWNKWKKRGKIKKMKKISYRWRPFPHWPGGVDKHWKHAPVAPLEGYGLHDRTLRCPVFPAPTTTRYFLLLLLLQLPGISYSHLYCYYILLYYYTRGTICGVWSSWSNASLPGVIVNFRGHVYLKSLKALTKWGGEVTCFFPFFPFFAGIRRGLPLTS